jgi:hypothetical protein
VQPDAVTVIMTIATTTTTTMTTMMMMMMIIMMTTRTIMMMILHLSRQVCLSNVTSVHTVVVAGGAFYRQRARFEQPLPVTAVTVGCR